MKASADCGPPGGLPWPRPLLTLQRVSSFMSPVALHTSTQPKWLQTFIYTVLPYCSSVTAVVFVGMWCMMQAVQRTGTNTVNTLPTRRGSWLRRRDCPQLRLLTESFGPWFWQEQALGEEDMVKMCILRRMLQCSFVPVYKQELG